MVLAIDIGNSNIVLGGYQNDKNTFVTRMATEGRMEADQYAIQLKGILALYGVSSSQLDSIIVSSVVPRLTPVIMQAITHFTSAEPILFTLASAGDMVIDIERPAELGMDILASAIAVKESYPLPAVIIDMGTATKLTALDEKGVLRGVAIAPGLFLSLDALVSSASQLGGVSPKAPPVAIGRNTPDSMNSGIVFGAASMLDGMIDRFAKEIGKPASLVATGGAAPIVVPHCNHTITFSDTLLLDGLYHVYKTNSSAHNS